MSEGSWRIRQGTMSRERLIQLLLFEGYIIALFTLFLVIIAQLLIPGLPRDLVLGFLVLYAVRLMIIDVQCVSFWIRREVRRRRMRRRDRPRKPSRPQTARSWRRARVAVSGGRLVTLSLAVGFAFATGSVAVALALAALYPEGPGMLAVAFFILLIAHGFAYFGWIVVTGLMPFAWTRAGRRSARLRRRAATAPTVPVSIRASP